MIYFIKRKAFNIDHGRVVSIISLQNKIMRYKREFETFHHFASCYSTIDIWPSYGKRSGHLTEVGSHPLAPDLSPICSLYREAYKWNKAVKPSFGLLHVVRVEVCSKRQIYSYLDWVAGSAGVKPGSPKIWNMDWCKKICSRFYLEYIFRFRLSGSIVLTLSHNYDFLSNHFDWVSHNQVIFLAKPSFPIPWETDISRCTNQKTNRCSDSPHKSYKWTRTADFWATQRFACLQGLTHNLCIN